MFRYRPYGNTHRDGAGSHAPHINLIYVDDDVHVELKKQIQSGEQRTLVLKAEQFFEISFKSDDIRKAGREIANYHGRNSEKQPSNEVGVLKFIFRSDSEGDRREHLYEWEIPNSDLRVSVRNRRSDGKRPRDTDFVVEVRVFNERGYPTDGGIMMAWNNFNGTFVHNRAERRNRIQEMRRNGVVNAPTPTMTTISSKKNLSEWTIDEQLVNKEAHTCVICIDTYMKGDKIHGLPKCSHFFHAQCINTWLVGSNNCPVCRSEV